MLAAVIIAAAAGALVTGMVLRRSGIATGEMESWMSGAGWPVSVVLVFSASAATAAGLLCLPRITRDVRAARPSARLTRSLAAFALGPLLLAMFFSLTGLLAGGATTGAPAPIAILAGPLLLALIYWKMVARLAARLLMSFFVWAALLTLPAFWSDAVGQAAVGAIIALFRRIGVLT